MRPTKVGVANPNTCWELAIYRSQLVMIPIPPVHSMFFILQVMVYKDIATKQNVSLMTYLSLYSPPVDWILECLAENSEEKQLLTVLKQVQQHANRYSVRKNKP